MTGAYELPHFCETAEVAEALAGLSRTQRRALRSYVWQVELGETCKTDWLAEQTFGDAWYRTGKQARYEHNEQFQTALRLYLRSALRWSTAEEQQAISKANRTLRMAADRAARRVVDLVDNGEKDRDRLDAAKTVLSAAGISGEQVTVNLGAGDVQRMTDDELERIARGERGGSGGGAAAPAVGA